GQPARLVRKVRKGAAFQDVDVEHHDADGGRRDEGGDVPPDANPPPKGLTEKFPKPAEPGGPRDDRYRAEKGPESPKNDQYRRGRRRNMPELAVGSDEG